MNPLSHERRPTRLVIDYGLGDPLDARRRDDCMPVEGLIARYHGSRGPWWP